MESFSETLRILRTRQGLTQSQLAEKVGLSPSAISMYENGRREPTFDILEAFAQVFALQPQDLLPNGKGGEDIWALREDLARRPEIGLLLSIARESSRADVLRAIRILAALQAAEDD